MAGKVYKQRIECRDHEHAEKYRLDGRRIFKQITVGDKNEYVQVKKKCQPGEKYFRDSKSWTLEYYYRGRRKHQTSTAYTLKAAEEELRGILSDIDQGRRIIKKPRRQELLKELIEPYFARQRTKKKRPNKESTLVIKEFYLRKLLPVFGEKFPDEITVEDIEKYVTLRDKEVSPATVTNELSTLSHILEFCIEKGYITQNPVSLLDRDREEKHRERAFKEGEKERLLEAVVRDQLVMREKKRVRLKPDPQLKTMIQVTLMTGLRKSELLNLQWTDIDFKEDCLTVCESKTTAGERTVPFKGTLKGILLAHYNGGASRYDYVFSSPKGTRIKNFRARWDTALEKAGIEDFHWHDLRHQYGTDMVAAGMPIGTLMQFMGHRDIKTTMLYVNPGMKEKRAAVADVESFFQGYCTKIDINSVNQDKIQTSQNPEGIVSLANIGTV